MPRYPIAPGMPLGPQVNYYAPSRMRRRPKRSKRGNLKKIIRAELHKNLEHKYYDTVFAAGAVDFSGTCTSLCDVPQGNTDTNRIADSIQPTSLTIRLLFAAGDAYNAMRMIIFRWTQSTAITGSDPPSVNQILQYTGSAQAPYSPLHHDNRADFEILYDKLIALNLGASNNTVITTRKTKKLANKSVNYVAGGTTGVNKIYVLFISDSGAATHPGVSGYIRLNFVDG